MAVTYTLTTWKVLPGMDEEFVERWTEWVQWSRRQGLVADAQLLRDLDHGGTFVSFGPWESLDAVRSWRSLPGYHERVSRLHEVVESFAPRTLEVVTQR